MKVLLKKWKDKSKEYLSTNTLFVAFVLSNLANAILLRAFTIGNILNIKPFIADLAFLLIIGSVAYFIKKYKYKFTYLLVVSIILTTICVINSIYYTFYESFASVSLIPTSILVVDVRDSITKNVLQLKDFIYIWQVVFFSIFNYILVKRKVHEKLIYRSNTKKLALKTLKVAFITLLIFLLTLTATEVNRLLNQRNRPYVVGTYGLYIYQISDIVSNLNPKISNMFWYDEAVKKTSDFYEKYPKNTNSNKYTNIYADKDIIMIHAESMQQNMLGLKFNGKEVTPNLNKLAASGLYFNNFYPQVSVGTSSDTELTISTSLLPVTNGTVFMSYSDRTFKSMPNMLKEKGYYPVSMHGNIGTFWNREVMHKNLGYEYFYSEKDYKIDEKIGLGLSDVSFFKQSVRKLKALKEEVNRPIYATLISLTNHSPFDDIKKYGEFNTEHLEGTRLGNYIKSVHYADYALGILLEELEKSGLLDNAVIVVYGDHDARLSKDEYNNLYNYDKKTDKLLTPNDPDYQEIDFYFYESIRRVPLIIWNKEEKYVETVGEVMGMYDVLPTLGNMFDFYNKYSLGNDIFNTNGNIVVFPNGNFVTNKLYYNASKDEYKALHPLESNYLNNHMKYAEELLDVTNAIIEFDLLKE